ncbi:hypothetical protein TKK_0009770 [Trichogramma kaykai]
MRKQMGADMLRHNSYVDDFYVGADTVQNASAAQRELINILMAGGFSLSKWASNEPSLRIGDNCDSKAIPQAEGVSALGLNWNSQSDSFSLKVSLSTKSTESPTERSILSDLARLFDPQGWFCPVLIFAKIVIQDTWLLNVDWDQRLPSSLSNKWIEFHQSLVELESIQVPRWLGVCPKNRHTIELHGFSDACERAYAACVYIRVLLPNGNYQSNLLVAKTRVAPVKTLSIPKLELCAATLLVELLSRIKSGLQLDEVPTYGWTDSKVVLAWISNHASKWTPFVESQKYKHFYLPKIGIMSLQDKIPLMLQLVA